MGFAVRNYSESDFESVNSWWIRNGMSEIWKALLPIETTYMLEYDDKPILCACLYLMNSKNACMVENLVADPDFDREKRKEGVEILFSHLENVAKGHGYNTLVLFTPENGLKRRYEELGFVKTLDNVSTFAKDISRCPGY